MDIDAGMVTGLLGIGASAIAILRTREDAKAKAYADARKDLGDCKETTAEQASKIEAQATRIDDLAGQVDILGRGLNDCIEKHDMAERASAAMRTEMDGLRRSISSGR